MVGAFVEGVVGSVSWVGVEVLELGLVAGVVEPVVGEPVVAGVVLKVVVFGSDVTVVPA